MAVAAGHKFGQDLGNFLEEVVLKDILRPKLVEYTAELGYYLDYQMDRPARGGKKVVWEDKYGNSHSLDFVIEAGGDKDTIGQPVAFIESAWRRYTKHSKNKAQEIQGAILPIVEKHLTDAPFVGVVLAGEFTRPSITQLKSQNFSVIHIPYQVIVTSFRAIGVELEFDESTDDADFLRASAEIKQLKPDEVDELRAGICAQCQQDIDEFMCTLHDVLRRHVEEISVRPVWGEERRGTSIGDAKKALASIDLAQPRGTFIRFEVAVRYSNGDTIQANFETRDEAGEFLERLVARQPKSPGAASRN